MPPIKFALNCVHAKNVSLVLSRVWATGGNNQAKFSSTKLRRPASVRLYLFCASTLVRCYIQTMPKFPKWEWVCVKILLLPFPFYNLLFPMGENTYIQINIFVEDLRYFPISAFIMRKVNNLLEDSEKGLQHPRIAH